MHYSTYLIKSAVVKAAAPVPIRPMPAPRPVPRPALKPVQEPSMASRLGGMATAGAGLVGQGLRGGADFVGRHPLATLGGLTGLGLGYGGYKAVQGLNSLLNPRNQELDDATKAALGEKPM